ncbi:MAG: hypothetical protein JSS65_09525 [Armatimonadetes bacterium]|nr:hypothetical protein [Armatimonadota bacterium]
MPTITYRPVDVLHWFGMESRSSRRSGFHKGGQLAKKTSEQGVVQGLRLAASAAFDLTKSAAGDLVQAQAGQTEYVLHESGFEVIDLVRRIKIDYAQVQKIIAKNNDRFLVVADSSKVAIKPVAHLTAGQIRVPVGWVRNGMEVPYSTLVEELSARCTVEVTAE